MHSLGMACRRKRFLQRPLVGRSWQLPNLGISAETALERRFFLWRGTALVGIKIGSPFSGCPALVPEMAGGLRPHVRLLLQEMLAAPADGTRLLETHRHQLPALLGRLVLLAACRFTRITGHSPPCRMRLRGLRLPNPFSSLLSFCKVPALSKNHLSGSLPPSLQGWQRRIRLTPNHQPLRLPYLSMA